MDFGKVPESELNTIDFSLPVDPVFNKLVLTGKPVQNPRICIGCAKWGRKEWVGKIYPPKTKEKDFLKHYVKHYNSLELNATYHKIYNEVAVKKWADQADKKDFLFCPKMNQDVTHNGSLLGKGDIVSDFLRGVRAFDGKLGPIFIQVSESFSPKKKVELFDFLRSLPTDLQFFMEVRHQSWFENKEISNELFSFFRDMNIGAIITDAAGRRDCVHMHLPIAKAFIRFVGNSLHKTDYTRIDEWVKRIKYWLDNGLEELYFFMHMPDEAQSPDLTVYLVDKLNAACGLKLARPTIISNSKGLFD